MARVIVSQFRLECRGERQQFAALLSLVRLPFPSPHVADLNVNHKQLMQRATDDAPDRPLSASQYLLFFA